MTRALGDIQKTGQRHAMDNSVNASHSVKYHALAWAKHECKARRSALLCSEILLKEGNKAASNLVLMVIGQDGLDT
jgi:hypothetical protein